jgi:hypothetical protein
MTRSDGRYSEVLASQSVKNLTARSGLMFEDAGDHELNGCASPMAQLPGRWVGSNLIGGPEQRRLIAAPDNH